MEGFSGKNSCASIVVLLAFEEHLERGRRIDRRSRLFPERTEVLSGGTRRS